MFFYLIFAFISCWWFLSASFSCWNKSSLSSSYKALFFRENVRSIATILFACRRCCSVHVQEDYFWWLWCHCKHFLCRDFSRQLPFLRQWYIVNALCIFLERFSDSFFLDKFNFFFFDCSSANFIARATFFLFFFLFLKVLLSKILPTIFC